MAVLAIDPTRSRGGGALLGDRIRMSSLDGDRVFFRSLATRGGSQVPTHLDDVLDIVRAAGFDLVILETPGIGQGDAAVVDYADVSLYVMTPEFGASSQLEKIDMLDRADVVAINKFERRGAEDALRDVGRQMVRNREAFGKSPADMPVYGTSAATFNDDGVTALYQELRDLLSDKGMPVDEGVLPARRHEAVDAHRDDRARLAGALLAEISDTVRGYHEATERYAAAASRVQRLESVRGELAAAAAADEVGSAESAVDAVEALLDEARTDLPHEVAGALTAWPSVVESYSGDEQVVPHPRQGDPQRPSRGSRCRATRSLVSHCPVTATTASSSASCVVRTSRATSPSPPVSSRSSARARTPPACSRGGRPVPHQPAVQAALRGPAGDAPVDGLRLRDALRPGPRPAPRRLRQGRHVGRLHRDARRHEGALRRLRPRLATTSVSMTINGPAPTILAFFLNTAIDQQVDAFRAREGREPNDAERAELTAYALANVRGTVQADILKEDQGQNTCIFSTEFSLKMMADIQEWFIEHQVRNFYSVSISGYHIAEAGANPISQLAFTLANGFTYVEGYLARGMKVDDFAPNLSFFFSNGMDPEYSVLGRVARRIWAVAMKERYGAGGSGRRS